MPLVGNDFIPFHTDGKNLFCCELPGSNANFLNAKKNQTNIFEFHNDTLWSLAYVKQNQYAVNWFEYYHINTVLNQTVHCNI